MSMWDELRTYAVRTKNALLLKAAQYAYKLKERGFTDTDIAHKIYNNYGFIMHVGSQGMRLVGANPKKQRKNKRRR